MHRKLLSSIVLGFLFLGAYPPPETSPIVPREYDSASVDHGAPGTAARRPGISTRRIAAHPVAPRPKPRLLPVVDQRDIREEHKIIADELLRLLPASCHGALKNFYVRYGPTESRGYAGASTVIVSGLLPAQEFRSLLAHEFTHVVDLGCLTGNLGSGRSEFRDGATVFWNDDPSLAFYRISWTAEKKRRKDARAADFISGYAASDAFEDMAEFVAAVLLHPTYVEARAAEHPVIARKLAWVRAYVLPASVRPSASALTWNGDIPWDMTKQLYEWNP